MSYQNAIDRASQISKEMTAGIDPNRQKAEQIAKNAEFEQVKHRQSITFGNAFSDYFNTKRVIGQSDTLQTTLKPPNLIYQTNPTKTAVWHIFGIHLVSIKSRLY